MTPPEIIAAYDALLAKALKIGEASPSYVSVTEYNRLSIDDGVAYLIWPDAQGGVYDERPRIEMESINFPAALLTMDDAAIQNWAKEERRIREAAYAKQRADVAAQNEAKERAMYEALKAKYR